MSDLWYLVYDTLPDAHAAACSLLKGSKAQKVLIVHADADAPANLLGDDTIVIRARELALTDWFIVTVPSGDGTNPAIVAGC